MSEVLAMLRVSPVRRVLGLAVMGLLAGLLLYIALVRPPVAPGWRAFLLALGGGTLLLAEAMRRATGRTLLLTRAGLFDGDGREIARIDRIAGVERGAFAFKPSNGFTLRLSEPGPRAWAPGVWWRLGRRVGVGGVTSAGEARAIADLLAAMLAGEDPDGFGPDGQGPTPH